MGTCQKDYNSLTDTNKKIFSALTSYRAIAAWIIFVYHFMPFNNPKYPTSIKQFVWGFHIGVDMFFVLSGFLITYFINDYITDNKLMIFILLNIVSIVLFHYIEEPLNKFIRKKYSS